MIFFLIFLHSIHQVDIKNVVKSSQHFFGYFNKGLETLGGMFILFDVQLQIAFDSIVLKSLVQFCINLLSLTGFYSVHRFITT